MDVPVRIEEASYFRTRCKQRWEWVHGSKPVTLVRWQAGKAVNASRFPCASPSAKAEGSADKAFQAQKMATGDFLTAGKVGCLFDPTKTRQFGH